MTEVLNSLGHFRPLAQLGQGGMARVLLVARQGPANIQKLLVLKEIREEFANDAEFVTMFMDEARLATRMNHPNLVQTYDVGEDGTRHFMVMEYLEGQPMHALLGRLKRKLPLPTHLHMIQRVLSGLHYAHDLHGFDGKPLSVVHRDVSPQNTFICYDGQVTLVDCGIAKAAGAVAKTSAGVFKGKLGYVAPEQVAGSDVDRRADVFSVGVMLWEALVGRRMTYGENEAAVLHKRTTGTQARVLEARPEADPELAAICDRAMSLQPDVRFATAAEMQKAIEARMDALGMRATDADVAKLVSDAFAEERKGIRALIERQFSLPARTAADKSAVAKLPMVQNDEPGPQSIPPSSGVPQSANISGSVRAPTPVAGWTPVTSSNPPIVGTSTSLSVSGKFRTPRRTMLLVGAGAMVVLVGVVAIAAVAARGSSAVKKADPELARSAPVLTPTNAVPAASVDVSIDVVPARANISLDGKPLGHGPFRGAFAKDGSQHQIVVSADGYTTETRPIVLDRDSRLEIALHPQGAVRSGPIGAVIPPAASASASATAGSELQVGPKPHHNIDEKDPYQ